MGHFNAAVCRLLRGDFARGCQQHEWRWETKQLRAVKRRFAQPLWTGADDLAGKTILLHAEQGFGDTIQFCRYLPQVVERGASIIVEVQKPLYELMKSLGGRVQIVPRGAALPDFDLHCPLLSLPLAFGTRLETIPSQTPYLTAPENKTRAWRDRLDKHELGKHQQPESRSGVGGRSAQKPAGRQSDRSSAQSPIRPAGAALGGARLRILQPAKRRRCAGAIARQRVKPPHHRLVGRLP